MRWLIAPALVLISMGAGVGQKAPETSGQTEPVRLLADQETKDGGTLKLRGHVQVISATTIVYADEADYNPLAGELEARGHVHVAFKNARPKITIENATPEDLPVMAPRLKK